jgi:hypothetical protein
MRGIPIESANFCRHIWATATALDVNYGDNIESWSKKACQRKALADTALKDAHSILQRCKGSGGAIGFSISDVGITTRD